MCSNVQHTYHSALKMEKKCNKDILNVWGCLQVTISKSQHCVLPLIVTFHIISATFLNCTFLNKFLEHCDTRVVPSLSNIEVMTPQLLSSTDIIMCSNSYDNSKSNVCPILQRLLGLDSQCHLAMDTSPFIKQRPHLSRIR